MIKKILSIFFACIFVMVSLSYGDGVMYSTALDYISPEDRESAIIYRTSYEGSNVNDTWNFIYTLVARQNGNIHIEIQCKSYKSSWGNNIQDIGNIAFNDTMIASVNEQGASGISTYYGESYSKFIQSYDVSNIIYTVIYSDGGSNLVGQTLMTFNLYVKEPYLTTNQVINFFGNEIEIPFGEPYVDKDTYIQELEGKISKLEDRITELESGSITPYKPGDINGDDIIDATDASLILCYYAYLMTGGDPNIGILDFEE